MFFAMVPKTFLDQMLALKSNQATGKLEPDAAHVSHSTQWRGKSFLPIGLYVKRHVEPS